MVSDEVSQFLKEAAQLRDQQIAEDQARSKELEEEILAAKAERLARRGAFQSFFFGRFYICLFMLYNAPLPSGMFWPFFETVGLGVNQRVFFVCLF